MFPEHSVPNTAQPIFPTRLAWLCHPEQIEYTLYLLFCLHHWSRASQRLLYADRQGLREVQALVLEEAHRRGIIQAVTYLDGTPRFPGELLLESAANSAARGVLIHLKNLSDPEIWPPFAPDESGTYECFIRPLYKRLTGQNFSRVADAVHVLEQEQIRAHIEEGLRRLVACASATRQPIPLRRLASLCIAPVDLLPIQENRLYFLDGYRSWEDLERSDRRKLDPEGYSEIAFQYASSTAAYVFHLPFRHAELFLPAEQLHALRQTPGRSQERAMFQGKVIDEKEGLKRSAREIIQDLGIDSAQMCPHRLVEKAHYLAQPSVRELLWPTIGRDGHDWTDDPWDGLCLPPEGR